MQALEDDSDPNFGDADYQLAAYAAAFFVLIFPGDIESVSMIQVGNGSALPGYYMYHGGTNPEGRLSTLQESQATNYWNDLPVKTMPRGQSWASSALDQITWGAGPPGSTKML